MGREGIRVAYLLLVHNHAEQLNLFLKQLLGYGDCDIYIHVDKKSSYMLPKIMSDPRIQVVSHYEIRWASFEMMAATIDLMKLVVGSEKRYSHVYYGSGNDLLVKNGLYEYLKNHPGKIFMNLYWEGGRVTSEMRASARYKIRWPKCLMVRNDLHPYRFVRIGMQFLCQAGIILFRNKINIDHLQLKKYIGSQWWIMPYEVIEYFVDYLKLHPEYVDYWREALAPDEFFFQTLVMNSPYRNCVEPSLMYINAGTTFATKNHPLIITSTDREKIEKENYFCARKFDIMAERESFMYYVDSVKEGTKSR